MLPSNALIQTQTSTIALWVTFEYVYNTSYVNYHKLQKYEMIKWIYIFIKQLIINDN